MDREKDGWEFVKCYLSNDLTSDSEDEKQLNKARREAASNKKKREANKLKDREKQFRNTPLFRRKKQRTKFLQQSVQNIKNLLFLRKRRTFLAPLSHQKNGIILILLSGGTGKSQKKRKTFQYGED